MQRVTDELMLRLGALPVLPVVLGEFAIGVLVAVIVTEPAATVVGVVLLVVLALYCFARPRDGWSVWGAAAAPAAVGSIASTFGGPRWIGLCVIPISLLILLAVDHGAPAAGSADAADGQPG